MPYYLCLSWLFYFFTLTHSALCYGVSKSESEFRCKITFLDNVTGSLRDTNCPCCPLLSLGQRRKSIGLYGQLSLLSSPGKKKEVIALKMFFFFGKLDSFNFAFVQTVSLPETSKLFIYCYCSIAAAKKTISSGCFDFFHSMAKVDKETNLHFFSE